VTLFGLPGEEGIERVWILLATCLEVGNGVRVFSFGDSAFVAHRGWFHKTLIVPLTSINVGHSGGEGKGQ